VLSYVNTDKNNTQETEMDPVTQYIASLDDYALVNRMCSVSPGVDEMRRQELYGDPDIPIDALTRTFVRNRLAGKLMQELADIGILSHDPTDEIITNNASLDAAIQLRRLMDGGELLGWLDTSSENNQAAIVGYIDGMEDDCEEAVVDMVAFMQVNWMDPVSPVLENLRQRIPMFYSDHRFKRHLGAVVQHLDAVEDTTVTRDPVAEASITTDEV
jgi:hypothetical protein